jgi:hypothetical protein
MLERDKRQLVSGSIVPQAMALPVERWMLKQVQHDGYDATNFDSTILGSVSGRSSITPWRSVP